MTEDPIAVLERELVDAARRRASGRPRVRRRLSVGALASAALIAVALAVAGGAVILLGGHKRPAAATATDRSRQQLIDILAVLRRPQTKTDRSYPKNIARPRPLMALGGGAPDIPLIRYATTTPWGERLFFVPMKPPTASEIAASVNQFPRRLRPQAARDIARQAARGETLGVFSSSGGGGDASASDIKAGYSLGTEGAGRSFAGGSTRTRLILVVPGGVAKVVFVLPRQPAAALYGAPVYKHSLIVPVLVHDNVAAVQVDRQLPSGRPPMIWYAAGRHVIKRIGDFSSVNRVIAPPKPALETPLSRAAERNPSTPNRVWVTPQTGGRHTAFRVHFRVLLTDADYHYTFSGTHCPQFTFPGGTGGGPNDLRGDLWSDPLTAVQGQALCSGTYRVSVTVMDLGRYGNLKHPARPFGSATFTVGP
jgi:hypothetical protein